MNNMLISSIALIIVFMLAWLIPIHNNNRNFQGHQLQNSINHTEKVEKNIISVFNQQCNTVDGLVLEDNEKFICIKPEAIAFFYMR